MDISIHLLTFSAFVVLIYGYKILNWVWFRPKYLEKRLQKQGFCGNSYRLLYGDAKDIRTMTKEALSKPINFSHDFAHRVAPIFHTALKKFGENCFVWLGPTPAILVLDPKSIREVVSKSYVFRKPPGRPFIRLMSRGLVTLETDKWAKHRRLIIPAGVQLLLPVYLLHHDCRIWGEDAKEFKPERFGDGVPKAAQGQMAYFPFGWGPRICVAQNFAMAEAKMAVAVILLNYSFQLSPSYAHAPHQVIALQPQHGAHLILTKL